MTRCKKSAALVLSVLTVVLALACPVSAETETIEENCFVVKEYNGKIALFSEIETDPIAVYSTPIDYINPTDAELLTDGIRLKSMDEVARLLEDLDVE